MSWLKNIIITMVKGNLQESRNRRAFKCLSAMSFGPVEVRKALLDLNKIRVKDLLGDAEVGQAVIYETIRGIKKNQKAMKLLADRLGLSVEELFVDFFDQENDDGLPDKCEAPWGCTPKAPAGNLNG